MTANDDTTRSGTADILLLLASYSVRVSMFDKALAYSEVAHILFPDDSAILELHVYALFCVGRYEDALARLAPCEAQSPNLSYLRARLAIMTSASDTEIGEHLRSYLKQAS